jgi:hypothetical protein
MIITPYGILIDHFPEISQNKQDETGTKSCPALAA